MKDNEEQMYEYAAIKAAEFDGKKVLNLRKVHFPRLQSIIINSSIFQEKEYELKDSFINEIALLLQKYDLKLDSICLEDK